MINNGKTNNIKSGSPDRFGFEWNTYIYKKDEAIALLENVGLVDVKIKRVNEMSWAVMGIKPISEK